MEWVSYIATQPHSDTPSCVSPVLRAFCTTLNDALDDGPRQQLRPYLVRTIWTADDGADEDRAWAVTNWLIRTSSSCWLTAAGVPASAARLAALPAGVDAPGVEEALDELLAAEIALRIRASAASGPVGSNRGPSGAAERLATRTARRSVAAAAWAAECRPVGGRAGRCARAVARAIARDAARTVAREATRDAGRLAAKEAVRVALAPTLTQLEATLFALLDRMLPTVPLEPPVRRATSRIP
jgi:hypothetical protein